MVFDIVNFDDAAIPFTVTSINLTTQLLDSPCFVIPAFSTDKQTEGTGWKILSLTMVVAGQTHIFSTSKAGHLEVGIPHFKTFVVADGTLSFSSKTREEILAEAKSGKK